MTLGLGGCWLPRGDLDGNKQSRFQAESSLSGTVKAEKPVEQARAKVLKDVPPRQPEGPRRPCPAVPAVKAADPGCAPHLEGPRPGPEVPTA